MRPECGLCEDMARDLSRLHVPFDTVNVELDEAVEASFGEYIPVLFDGEREVARAPHTFDSLQKALKREGLL
jgi:hypothetical protein